MLGLKLIYVSKMEPMKNDLLTTSELKIAGKSLPD